MSLSAASLVSSIGWTLLHFIWQGALIGCATAIALAAMRGARPERRYAVACGALMLCVAWPAIELVSRLSGSAAAGEAVRLTMQSVSGSNAADAGALAWLQAKLGWIVMGWAACACALTLRMGMGLWWIGRLANRDGAHPHWQSRVSAIARQFGITREVRLRVVDRLASPITAGWWRPVVLVPASLIAGMPPDLLEALLAHEMGHIRRFDYLVNLGQNVVETLLFYHPAVWWISGRIRAEREQIADDLAAAHLGDARRLALALSELEKLQFSGQHLAMAANGGELVARIRRLLRPDAQALNWKAAIAMCAMATPCLAAALHVPAQAKAQHVRTRAVADFRTCAKPLWPTQSLKDQNTGTVTLSFLIDAEGRVADSKILRSSGFRPLDRAAREGIALCRFKPATEDGVPVQAWRKMQYVWLLK